MQSQQRSSGVDLLTLVIAAVAGAAAAYITSELWAGGTLITAAITPVIVALVKEGLARPVDKIVTLRTDRVTGEMDAVEEHPAPAAVTSNKRRWVQMGLITGAIGFVIVVAVYTVPELVAGKSIGRSGGGNATTLFGGRERTKSKSNATDTKKSKPSSGSDAKDEQDADTTPTPTPTEEATEQPTEEPTAQPTETPTEEATVAPTVTAAPTDTPAP